MPKVYMDKSKAAMCPKCGYRASSHRIRAKHALLFHGAMIDQFDKVVPLDPDIAEERQDELLKQLDTHGPHWRVFGLPEQRPDHWGAAAAAEHAPPTPSSPVFTPMGRGVTVEYLDCDPPSPGPALQPRGRATRFPPPWYFAFPPPGASTLEAEPVFSTYSLPANIPPPPEFADAPEDEDEEPSVYPSPDAPMKIVRFRLE